MRVWMKVGIRVSVTRGDALVWPQCDKRGLEG